MKYDWSLIRKGFLIGLPMTVVGVIFVIYFGWDEATIILLGIGSVFLVCSVMATLFYLLMARGGASRLPEDWDTLSLEEKQDFARKRLREKNSWSSKATLWMMRAHDVQRHNVEEDIAERDD